MKSRIVFTLCVLFVCGFLMAQTNTTPEEHIDLFFQKMDTEGVESGFNYLFSTNKYLSESVEVEKLAIEFEMSQKMMGNFCGYEIIKEYPLGNSLIQSMIVNHYDSDLYFIKLWINGDSKILNMMMAS